MVSDCMMPCFLSVSRELYTVVLESDGWSLLRDEYIVSALGWVLCSSRYFRVINL